MKIYNSLTKQKEEFVPKVQGQVNMYSCGPTVYYYPHIGNMRAYLFMDLLRRAFAFNGYEVNSAMNITDVGHLTSDEDDGDDKMEVASKRENKTVYEIAAFYTEIFLNTFKKLNILMPNHITKATEYIPQMIEFIKKLEDKGYTYILDDGVYFDIQKFKEYGQLSNKDLDSENRARIQTNSNKRHDFDFALWKKVDDNHIMKWDSPWGVGCPGWHIECSAMGNDVFGENIDVHTGGIDHLSVHHENEIAQNDCCIGKRVVSYWLHCEFLQVNGGKMSKSLNNLYTIEQLEEKGYNALDFRYFCLTTYYRKAINFTFEGLDAAKNARANLQKALVKHKDVKIKTDSEIINDLSKKFKDAINDDLNTPLALSYIFAAVKNQPSNDIYEFVLKCDEVLGLEIDKMEQNQTPKEICELAEKRWNAKQNRDFALADELRKQIDNLGYNILDSKTGYEIEKK